MRFDLLSQRLHSLTREVYLGIRTTGYVSPTVEWGVHYTPIPYQVIDRILDHLSLTEDDVFVDLGCGKGRVLCCACRRSLKRVVGIEVNEALSALAVENVNTVRGKRAAVETLAIPAEQYAFPDTTVIYLYNPFDRPIMDKVFSQVNAWYRENPRNVRIAYANCLHEQSLAELPWLRKLEEWPPTEFPGFGCPISFWESK